MRENKPLISIIVPAYNHEKFVGECLESIIDQTYKNIELIILNDGSKDTTAEVIRKYENKCKEIFTRFVFIDKENEGVCKTLNRGIKESNGEYFCFIASDDFMVNNCINNLVNYFIDNREVERVISNFYNYYYDIDDKEVYYKQNPKWVSYMNLYRQKFYIENILQNKIPVFGMYSKAAIDKVGLFDEDLLFEDWDMNLRILNKNIKLGYISEPLYNYRKHSSSTTNYSNNYEFMLEGCLQVIKKVEIDKSIIFKNKKTIIRKAKSCEYIRAASHLKKSKNIKYKKYIKKAIKECPQNIRIYKFLVRNLIKGVLN